MLVVAMLVSCDWSSGPVRLSTKPSRTLTTWAALVTLVGSNRTSGPVVLLLRPPGPWKSSIAPLEAIVLSVTLKNGPVMVLV